MVKRRELIHTPNKNGGIFGTLYELRATLPTTLPCIYRSIACSCITCSCNSSLVGGAMTIHDEAREQSVFPNGLKY